MISSAKHYLFLSLIYLALIGLGYLIINFFSSDLAFRDVLILITGAYVISLISTAVFYRGIKKTNGKGFLHTFSALGLKFLLFLALLGVFALLMEELSWHFLVGFLGAYLAFTIYLLITFVKVLKQKNQFKTDEKRK